MQAQSLANPFAYEAYIERRKHEKLEAERASRITVRSVLLFHVYYVFLM